MESTDALSMFFKEQAGRVLCVAEDMSLFRTLRYAISGLAGTTEETVLLCQEPEDAFEQLETFKKGTIPTIVVVERTIQGEKTTDFILRVSRLFPEMCLLIVGSGITKELAAYFCEIGVSSIISKPASAEDVLKKLVGCVVVSREQHLTTYVRELIADSRPEEALEAVSKYLAVRPESSLAYCLKGDILLTSGDLSEALVAYEKAVSLNTCFTEPLRRMAAVYKRVDDTKALGLLRKMDDINAFNPDRKLEMGEILLRQGDEDGARVQFDTGFKQASQEFSTLLGDYAERIASLASDSPELAKGYLAKVLETKKTFTAYDIHMFNKLGMLYRNNGEWSEALKVYTKALDIAPNDPALYYNMALAYHDGGKSGEVRRCLSKSFAIDATYYKGNEGVSYNIGAMYMGQGNAAEARPFFEHVLEINPKNDKARKKLDRCAPAPS